MNENFKVFQISVYAKLKKLGKTSAGESEVSATYQTDDLAPFKDDIKDWLNSNEDDSDDIGKFRFY